MLKRMWLRWWFDAEEAVQLGNRVLTFLWPAVIVFGLFVATTKGM